MTKAKTKQYDVFFVDDDTGICLLISEELKKIDCKASCFSNAADCLEQLSKQNCDLLITDVRMPGMDGITLLSKAKHVAPWVSVMIITGFADIPMSVKALKLGAVDFIEKPLDRKEFLHKVKTILEQGDFFDPPAHTSLTKTEKKVLKSIIQGKSNKEIAYKMDRSIRTVEFHRNNIMHKFKTDSLVDLIKKASAMDFAD